MDDAAEALQGIFLEICTAWWSTRVLFAASGRTEAKFMHGFLDKVAIIEQSSLAKPVFVSAFLQFCAGFTGILLFDRTQ